MPLGHNIVFTPSNEKEAISVTRRTPLPVQITGEEETQFGEVLTAERTPIIELNAIYGVSALRDITSTTNTGSVSDATSEILLSTGTTASSSAELFSAERGRYIPGFSAEAGVGVRIPTDPTGNQYAEWGLRSPNGQNGYLWGRDADGIYIKIINGGSATTIRQADFNRDKIDGTGISGLNFDEGDGYVYQIQFTYYGYGAIRFGVLGLIEGDQTFIPAHIERPRGGTSVEQPNLPVFVGAYNGADAADFDVYVGGRQYSIIGRYVPKFRTIGQERWGVSVGTTSVPLVTFRNKTGFEDRSVKLDNIFANVATEDCILEVYLNASLTGASYGTPTNATAAETGLEVDVSATAISGGLLVYADPATAGQANRALSISRQVDFDLPENQPITLAARSITGTATVDGFMRLIEEW